MTKVIDFEKKREEKAQDDLLAIMKELVEKTKREIEADPWPYMEELKAIIVDRTMRLAEIEAIVYPEIKHLESEFPDYVTSTDAVKW